MNYKCVKSNPITTTFATRINNSADAGAFNTNLIYMLPYYKGSQLSQDE